MPGDGSEIDIPASLTLARGEEPVGSWTCGVPNSPSSGVVKYEGHLVLTSTRLVYEPMHTPRVASRAASMMLGGSRREVALERLRAVEAVEGRLPRLRLDIDGEEPFVLIISSGRFSLPWGKKKWLAREEALQRIRDLLRSK